MEKLTPDFIIQLINNFSQCALGFLEGIVAFFLQQAQVHLGFQLPVQLILHLFDFAGMQFGQFLLGMLQLSFAGFNSLFQFGIMPQLELDQLLLQPSGFLPLRSQFGLVLRRESLLFV
jgi:hypothetical protein